MDTDVSDFSRAGVRLPRGIQGGQRFGGLVGGFEGILRTAWVVCRLRLAGKRRQRRDE